MGVIGELRDSLQKKVRAVISDDVLHFLQSFLPSVWTLEVLLLMRRAPAQGWTAQRINAELRASTLIVSNALAALIAAGLVVEDADALFCYRPVRAELGTLVDRLAMAYTETPFAVTQAILASPNEKIRTFADAFRVKKD
jgi:hypothetical protein